MSTPAAPHWDMLSVYPGVESEPFRRDTARLQELIAEMDGYLAAHAIRAGAAIDAAPAAVAQVIAGYLDRMNRLACLGHTLRAYLHAFVTTDSYDATARKRMSEIEPWLVRVEQQEVLFRGWVGTLAAQPELLEAALGLSATVRQHQFYLQETADQSRFLMSVEEEALAAELSLSGARAWEKLHGVLTSQLKVPLERDGQIQDLPITVVQNLKSDPDEAVRRAAFEAEMAGWRSVREPLAACLNGIKGSVRTLDGRRGRSDALHATLDQARIDRDTLTAMLDAVRDSFPAFRGYWRAKARLLGKSALAWWDLAAPVGQAARRYGFTEARDFILAQLGAFSEPLAAYTQSAFDRQWIDAEPRSGKRGGAFCMSLPALEESRILCNFDGSPGQVLTLAHELGHAYHNHCHTGLPSLLRRTPMTLAETASIFNETIVTDAMLAQAGDEEEALSVLEVFLAGSSQVVVDIYSRYLFESEVFERRAAAELSADDLCAIMLRAQQATYGDGLDPSALNPYMWAWKPHYYMPARSFYNFPYTFGLLFGLGLYALYRQQEQAFVARYDALLRGTGGATAAQLAAGFGIDIRQRSFWEGSLRIIQERIDRYRAIATAREP